MLSIGIHTPSPLTVPFMKAEFIGACLVGARARARLGVRARVRVRLVVRVRVHRRVPRPHVQALVAPLEQRHLVRVWVRVRVRASELTMAILTMATLTSGASYRESLVAAALAAAQQTLGVTQLEAQPDDALGLGSELGLG
eukprot:scaffold62606_cov29-Phaeocystis_antarctica.AAC.1